MSEGLDRWSTWAELSRQPDIWETWAQVLDIDGLRAWIDAQEADEIWLSGAGTSAFIGDLIAAALGPDARRIRSVASTDLVSSPHEFLRPGLRPLVVSFGRSGNSAESVGVLDVLDALAPDAPRLNITCNSDSALATRPPGRAVVLPPETHDSGFAMTSSYSTMVLTALALLDRGADAQARMKTLAQFARDLMPVYRKVAEGRGRPERIVFTGSGCLKYAARECALKVMELTAGQTAALWDSNLGFRHGPKSFVTDRTYCYVFRSSDPHSDRYDADLARELRQQFDGSQTLTVGPKADIAFDTGLPDVWNAPLYVLLSQVLAVVWSDAMGLDVDDPFAGQGTLTRVVSGVTLYAPSTPELA